MAVSLVQICFQVQIRFLVLWNYTHFKLLDKIWVPNIALLSEDERQNHGVEYMNKAEDAVFYDL